MKFNKEELDNMLSEKEIYKLLNNVDIDEKEFENIDIEVDSIRIKNLKNNLKKELKFKMSKKAKYGLSVACALAVSVVSVGAIGVKNPSFAKNIPVLNSIVKMLNGEYKGNYEKYAKNIGETQYDKGISITLNEAVYDETGVMITYTIESDKKLKELRGDFISDETIKINGKYGGFNGSTASKKEINEHTMTVLANYTLGMDDLSDKLYIEYDINKIFNVDGKWNFTFDLSKEELISETKKIKTDIVKNFEGTDINIDSVSFTPISTNIELSGKRNKNLNDLNSHFGFFEYDYWLLFDDNGREIVRRENSSGGGFLDSFKGGYRYDAVDSIPNYLTIVPLQYKLQVEFGRDENGKESVKRNKEEYIAKDVKKAVADKYPLVLEQGRFGKLTIIGIEESEDKTIVRYKSEGKLPYFQASQLYLENEDGEKLDQNITPINSGYDNTEYTLEVKKLDPNKKYYFVTNNLNNRDFKEEYIFKIPIK